MLVRLVLLTAVLTRSALAWPTASTTARSTTCSIAGQDGQAMHTHGGSEASVGTANFTITCTASTALTVEKIEFLTGASCDAPPARVSAEPKLGGIFIDGMKESALEVQIPPGAPVSVGVGFTPVGAYYTWCDRFAFRVRFRAGGEVVTATSELNVTREEPYREP